MKDTKRNFALKQLQKSISGGTIITPDKAVESKQTSILQELAGLQQLRDDITKALVYGKAYSHDRDEAMAPSAKGIVEYADALASALMRLKCEEVEAVNYATKGSRTAGFEYLCDVLGVERIEDAPEAIQLPHSDANGSPVVNLHG